MSDFRGRFQVQAMIDGKWTTLAAFVTIRHARLFHDVAGSGMRIWDTFTQEKIEAHG